MPGTLDYTIRRKLKAIAKTSGVAHKVVKAMYLVLNKQDREFFLREAYVEAKGVSSQEQT